jgi:crotonobetainyl-CoA:carnitine CoA-transferase CaiB-like acyl-CoA transferase
VGGAVRCNPGRRASADIAADPHFRQRGTTVEVPHPVWGNVVMQGLIAHLSKTPGRITSTGPRIGEHNDEILVGELGMDPGSLERITGQAARHGR